MSENNHIFIPAQLWFNRNSSLAFPWLIIGDDVFQYDKILRKDGTVVDWQSSPVFDPNSVWYNAEKHQELLNKPKA